MIRVVGPALGLAGFAVTLIFLHAGMELPARIDGYHDKLAYLERHAEEFSVLHVGSSRVFRHIVPASFDEAAAAGGFRSSSFNLGVDALNLLELRSLLDQIARTPGPEPRYVLIEPALGIGLHPRNAGTIRAAYFRDLENTGNEIDALGKSPGNWRSISRSLRACLNHYSLVGRLAHAYFPRSFARPGAPLDLDRGRGFQAQDDSSLAAEAGPWRHHLLENFDEISLAVRERRPPDEIVIQRFMPRVDILMDAVEKLAESGATPIFYISPIMQVSDPLRAFEEIHRRKQIQIPLISYQGQMDEIYDRAYWWNPGHMNGEGAALFSSRFGSDFAAYLIEGMAPGAPGKTDLAAQ